MNILFYIGELISFILLVFWFVFMPGRLVLLNLKSKLSSFESFTISLGLGVAMFTLLLFILGSLKIVYATYILLSLFNLYSLCHCEARQIGGLWQSNWGLLRLRLRRIPRNDIVTFLIIFICTLFAGSILFRSGMPDGRGGLSFTEYRDSFWHLGLMEELTRSIPPLHPGFSPLPLTNYHYFLHLFGAGFLKTSFFNPLDFYFRILPFFLVLLYCLSLYILGKKLAKSERGGNLSVLFGVLTGSFAYVLPLFINYPGFSWHESSFWLSQPFYMVINPSFALSSSILLMVCFLYFKIAEEKENSLLPVAVILAGILIVIKVYAGLLVLGGLLVAGLWKRNMTIIKWFISSLILSLLLFIPTSGKEAGSFLVFMPGWFLRSMAESPDRVQIIDWVLRENTYAASGNMLGVLRYRFYELLVYLAGNLGTRIFMFFGLLGAPVFLLIIAFTGMVLPLIFVQNGSIANTLQFSYYSLEIFSVLLAVWLVRKNIVIIVILLLLSIPTSLQLWYTSVVSYSPAVIDRDQVESFSFLRKNTKREEIIIVPYSYQYTESLVAGTLSDRRLFYSDRLMAENTHKNFKEREDEVNKFFNGVNISLLKNNSISYVYVDKRVVNNFQLKYYPLQKVFGNEKIDIYKVL